MEKEKKKRKIGGNEERTNKGGKRQEKRGKNRKVKGKKKGEGCYKRVMDVEKSRREMEYRKKHVK